MSRQSEYYYTRKVLSWLFFLAGVGSILAFFIGGAAQFWWLAIAFICFVFAYWVSPHQKSDHSGDAIELFFDELIIELIFKLITLPIRLIAKLLDHIGVIDIS